MAFQAACHENLLDIGFENLETGLHSFGVFRVWLGRGAVRLWLSLARVRDRNTDEQLTEKRAVEACSDWWHAVFHQAEEKLKGPCSRRPGPVYRFAVNEAI